MSVPYSKLFSTRETPQTEAIPGSTQVANSAGGFSWAVDDWVRLDRFLILGSEGGSYYATERKLTLENALAVVRCVQADGPRVVSRIVEISESGRAPKNDAALFALAIAFGTKAGAGSPETRAAALEALPKVARIGTHLFTFLEYVQSTRGWGRGLRRAVAKWYLEKTPEKLAHQMCKYRQRCTWSHRDALRLAHPKPKCVEQKALFGWATKGQAKVPDGAAPTWTLPLETPKLVFDFLALQGATSVPDVVRALESNDSLSWEMIPTQFLAERSVWEVLYTRLPMTALIRNLARMTANGLIAPMSEAARYLAKKIVNAEAIRDARVHPIAVLSALGTYSSGHGVRGSLVWNPVQQIVDALDEAFYVAFGNVTPTNKRWMLALDISGSMSDGDIAGVPGLTPREASAAMALVTARVEPSHMFVGFCQQLKPLAISPRQRLDDVVKYTERLIMGSTDCSLPMLWAMNNKVPVDAFVVYTDSETFAGHPHPAQALQIYRDKMGIPAKLIVVGMVSNEFTIADPNDAGMLDVVGMDTATPELISQFGAV